MGIIGSSLLEYLSGLARIKWWLFCNHRSCGEAVLIKTLKQTATVVGVV